MKHCPKCNSEKSDDCFYKVKLTKDNLSQYCKECTKLESRKRYKQNPEPAKKRARKRTPQEARRLRLLADYGLTLDEYDAMLEKQNYCCAICGSSDSKHHKSEHFCIDHSHTTGEVRGLLCNDCNLVIGRANDNTDVLSSAVEYLLKAG